MSFFGRCWELTAWPHTNDPGPEAAQDRVLTKIIRDLLVIISDEAHEDLLRQKFRSAPVDMKIDAVLVLRILVLQIVRESRHCGKFVARHRIEIGIAPATVDRAMTDADVGEAVGSYSPTGMSPVM